MCPYLELSDSRCSAHQSLRALDEALRLCADAFDACPLYRRFSDHAADDRHEVEPVRAAG